MVVRGCERVRAVCGCGRVCADVGGCSWVCVGVRGCVWVCMGVGGSGQKGGARMCMVLCMCVG